MVEKFALLAGLVYTLTEFLKPLYDRKEHKFDFDKIGAVLLGIALTVLTEIDFLAGLDVEFSVPYVGSVLSGVLVGGAVGAGFIHDFPDWIKSFFWKVPTHKVDEVKPE